MLISKPGRKAYDSNGGAIRTLQTPQGTFIPTIRSLNQTDANCKVLAKGTNAIPSNVATYVADLDLDFQKILQSTPLELGQKANRALFTRVTNLRPKTLRIMAGVARENAPWDPLLDARWISGGTAGNHHLTALPGLVDEDVSSLRSRMKFAQSQVRGQEMHERRQVVATIRLDAPNFQDLWLELYSQHEPLALVEFHGYKQARDNLEFIHKLTAKNSDAPVPFALNGSRYIIGNNAPRASGTLLTASFGCAGFIQKVPHGVPPSNDVEYWFDRRVGGYEHSGNLGTTFVSRAVEDRAVTSASPPWLQPASLALDLRRRDENWAHQMESKILNNHVAAGQFKQYLRRRTMLEAGIDWMA